MADAVGLASSLITLIATAYTLCQTVYNVFSGVHDAPRHIRNVQRDLEDLYNVLGTLSTIVQGNDEANSSADSFVSQDLENSLETSLSALRDLGEAIGEYKRCGSITQVGKWQRWKWTFQEKKFKDLGQTLNAQKITECRAFRCNLVRMMILGLRMLLRDFQ